MGILARQATLNTLLAYLGIGLGFVNVVLLYPKVLQADQFGLTRLLVSIATIAAQIAQLGADNTVNRYFPYFRDPARAHRGILGMLMLFGTITGLLSMLALGLMHGVLSDVFSDRSTLYADHGLLLLPLVLSEVFFILLRSYSRSLRRTVQPSFIREFLLRVLQTVLIGVQAWRPMPFATFMVLYTAIFLICTLALAFDLKRAGHWVLGWSERWMPGRLRRSMLMYSTFTFSASMAGIVLGNMDQMMIGALLKDALPHVAHYAVAFYFGSVIAAPGRALNQAAIPLLADAWKRGDTVMIGALYKRSALVQLVVSGFLFLLMWMGLDDLFELLPAEYADASQVALIIGLAYLLNSAIGLSTGIISMSRSYRLDAWSSLSMLLINALANFFLIRSMGIVGAAWATLISLVSVNAYRTWFLYLRYRMWPFERRTLGVFALVALIGSVVPWVPLTGTPTLDLVLRSVLITVVFWPAAHVLGLMPELAGMMRQVKERYL
ncbi:MAG: polysaccharide biosynthesis C-terminal domain-containing protein [Flavobacteriales bacterium]